MADRAGTRWTLLTAILIALAGCDGTPGPESRAKPGETEVVKVVSEHRVRICRADDTPIPNLLYALPVTAGGGEAWLQIDTGAGVTSTTATSPLVRGLRLDPGGETMGVAGRRQVYSVARDLTLSFAGFQRTVDAEVVEASHGGCGPDGLIGRDALSQCALILGHRRIAVTCD